MPSVRPEPTTTACARQPRGSQRAFALRRLAMNPSSFTDGSGVHDRTRAPPATVSEITALVRRRVYEVTGDRLSAGDTARIAALVDAGVDFEFFLAELRRAFAMPPEELARIAAEIRALAGPSVT